jgi:hypothetical protein
MARPGRQIVQLIKDDVTSLTTSCYATSTSTVTSLIVKTHALTRAESAAASAGPLCATIDGVGEANRLYLYAYDVVGVDDRVVLRQRVADTVIVSDQEDKQTALPIIDVISCSSGGLAKRVSTAPVTSVTAIDALTVWMPTITSADTITKADAQRKTVSNQVGDTATAASTPKYLFRKKVATSASAADNITTAAATISTTQFMVFQHTAGSIGFSASLSGSATYSADVKLIRVL